MFVYLLLAVNFLLYWKYLFTRHLSSIMRLLNLRTSFNLSWIASRSEMRRLNELLVVAGTSSVESRTLWMPDELDVQRSSLSQYSRLIFYCNWFWDSFEWCGTNQSSLISNWKTQAKLGRIRKSIFVSRLFQKEQQQKTYELHTYLMLRNLFLFLYIIFIHKVDIVILCCNFLHMSVAILNRVMPSSEFT